MSKCLSGTLLMEHWFLFHENSLALVQTLLLCLADVCPANFVQICQVEHILTAVFIPILCSWKTVVMSNRLAFSQDKRGGTGTPFGRKNKDPPWFLVSRTWSDEASLLPWHILIELPDWRSPPPSLFHIPGTLFSEAHVILSTSCIW